MLATHYFFLRFVSMVFCRKIKKGSSILKLKNKSSLFFSFLLLGDHEAFQVGGINESIFNKEFTVGIINFLVCEFVTESDEGVSEHFCEVDWTRSLRKHALGLTIGDGFADGAESSNNVAGGQETVLIGVHDTEGFFELLDLPLREESKHIGVTLLGFL